MVRPWLLVVLVVTGCEASNADDCPASCGAGTTCSSGACRQICSDSSVCATGEACFLGVCSPTASAPSVISLPTPGLIDLDFTASTLPTGVTFSREGPATTTDADGRLTTSAGARLEVDSRFGTGRGIFLESATTNICRASQELDNDTRWWSARTDRVANAAVAPDGSQTATRLTPGLTTEYHSIGQSILAEQGASYTFSIFLQAAELTNVYIGLTNEGRSFPNQLLDLSTGTLSQINDQLSITGAGVLDSGHGWYRAWIAFVNQAEPGDLSVMLELGLQPVSDNGLNAWGCQVERGVTPSSYVTTTSNASGTRASDALLVDSPARVDLATDFTVLVVQSVDVTTPLAAVGVAITPTAGGELVLGKRSSGEGSLTLTRADGASLINLAAGTAWRPAELHALAVSRQGDTVLFVDNGAVARITSTALRSATNPALAIRIGQRQTGSSAPTHVQRVVLWHEALDEATLVAMTRP